MNLRQELDKLKEEILLLQKKTFFIIPSSKEDEIKQIEKIKESFKGSLDLLTIMVFKLYE